MKKQQSKPYKTTPYKDGCTNQVEYDTLDIYGSGSVRKFYAVATRCDYVDKKGIEHIGHVLRVKWIDEYYYREQMISSIKDTIFMGCDIVPRFEYAFHEIVGKLDYNELDKVWYDLRQNSPFYKTDAFWKVLRLSGIICEAELARLDGRYESYS